MPVSEGMDVDDWASKFPPLRKTNDCEWTYTMRREMQEIIPGLYLGPYSCAMKKKRAALERAGISHIICVRQDVEANFIRPNFPNDFKYLVLEFADSLTESIIHIFPKVKVFIDDCFSNNGNVLIHGNAGISRSAALAIAYIMETFGQNLKDAFTVVQQQRFCINPNKSFMAQLSEYEAIYKAKVLFQVRERSQSTGRLKRRIGELEEDLGDLSFCKEY